jgi:hypothetical protein
VSCSTKLAFRANTPLVQPVSVGYAPVPVVHSEQPAGHQPRLEAADQDRDFPVDASADDDQVINLHRTDDMILKIFLPKKIGGKNCVFGSKQSQILKKMILTLVFEKNANFFRRKLSKIAENCEHNIDP